MGTLRSEARTAAAQTLPKRHILINRECRKAIYQVFLRPWQESNLRHTV